jgi:DNA-binding beta-propeller fold protein YncE
MRAWTLLAGIALVSVWIGACLDFDPRTERRGSPERVSGAKADDACDSPIHRRVPIPAGTGPIPIGGYANLVAVGEGYVWVPVADDSERVTLLRIDPVSGVIARWPYVGSSEVRIATSGGAVWLADPQTRRLTRIDATTGRQTVTRPFEGRRAPRELGVGAGGVWLVPGRGGDLAVADLADGKVSSRVRTGVQTIGDVAPAGGVVWLSTAGPPGVMRLDARTGRRLGRLVRVSATALDIAATEDRAWADLGDEDALVAVDAGKEEAALQAPNGGAAFAIALGFGSVWVTNYGRDTVTRLDATTGEPIGAPIPVGADPKGIAVGMGAVWVATAGACTLTRIVP